MPQASVVGHLIVTRTTHQRVGAIRRRGAVVAQEGM
jgi:hypothetical protein